ncbi:MAG: single-stranded DNA-binding protein [Treponema sp.]|jgi:single-strand DNA-binding protein|nr:single-stranded DNA-binding protein [Treponema sp.]MBR4628949.1 single-stranded DNA-binding protein [Treponema sp.]
MDVNTVVIVGRLVRDLNPSDSREFAYTPNGQARANISVAVNTRRKNGDQWVDEANYFNVTIWGKTAESLKPYLTKGRQIAIEGALKQERWQDKETGKTRDRVSIVADNVQLLGGSSGSRMEGGYQQSSTGAAPNYQPMNAAPQNQQNFAPQQSYQNGYQPQQMNGGDYGDMNNFPDEVPF